MVVEQVHENKFFQMQVTVEQSIVFSSNSSGYEDVLQRLLISVQTSLDLIAKHLKLRATLTFTG